MGTTLDNDAIGRIGHGVCNDLCDRGGLVPNSSLVDKTGWDVLAEFKDTLLEEPTTAATLHEGAPLCWIQVKTTTRKERSASIALTNLHRMSTNPLPAFVLLVRLDKEARYEVKGIDLVHVDQPLIRSVLERVHEASAKADPARPLNKLKMSVLGKQGNAIERGDGVAFRDALLNAIGPSFADYVTTKRQFVEQVGHEDGYGTVNITMHVEPGQPTLVDLMLGKIKRIPIDSVTTSLERFGIPDEPSCIEEEGGFLEMPDLTPELATIAFRASPFGVPVTTIGSIYRTLFGDDVADEHRRIRMVGPFFELEFARVHGGYSMEGMKIDLGQPMSLKDLDAGARLLEEWTTPGARPTAEIRRHGGSSNLRLTLDGEFAGVPPPTEVLETIHRAKRVVETFGGESGAHVQLGSLMPFGHRLVLLDMVTSDNKGTLRLQLGTDITEAMSGDKLLGIICTAGVAIAGSRYVVTMLVTGETLTGAEGNVALYTASHRVLHRMVLDRESDDLPEFQSELERLAEPFRHSHDIHFLSFL